MRRNRISRQESEQIDPTEIYLDNGIYSPSRELSIISNRMTEAEESGELKALEAEETKSNLESDEAKSKLASGKVQFKARDLSEKPLEALEKEEIEKETARSFGRARFESRELTRKKLQALEKKRLDADSRDEPIAQSPEEIRRKLSARDKTSSGKASFSSKDVKHEMPMKPDRRKNDITRQESPTGKAVFEAKELSKPAPKLKR